MNDQIIRLFEILKILNRYPNELTISQVKSRLDDIQIDVSERTVQRDMNTLMTLFIGIDNKKHADRSIGWFWSEDAPVMNLSGLTINQALSFNLIKKYLTPLFPSVTLNDLGPFFEQAEATLDGLHENPLHDWPNKIAVVQPTQPLLPLKVNADIQKIVSETLLADQQLEITYRRLDGVEQNYHLNPLGLVLRSGVSYLVASKIDTKDLRVFALHRMSSVQNKDVRAVHPDNFSLQQFIDEGHMGFNLTGKNPFKPIKLKAIFDAVSIQHLRETRLSEDQKIEERDDNNFMITATVQETEQLFWWLLSFGYRVEVKEPIELRQKMADSVTVLAKKYNVKST